MTDAAPASGAFRQLSRRDWIGLYAMFIGLFMAVLDIQIVASSLGEIGAGLSATIEETAWIQASYLTAEVIVIPLTAWLTRALSTRLLFTLSIGLFTLTSLLCGLAWDLESMIVFRVLQGLTGGSLIPLAFSTIYMIFPPERRAGMIVILALVANVAPTVGPTFGGWLTQLLAWQWLFYINLLPGALITLVAWTTIDIDRPNYALLKQIDVLGVILIAMFLGPLVYVLEEGPREDWFNSSTISVVAIVSLISGILLVWRELSAKHPVVDIRAFRNRNFLIGCTLSFTFGIALYGSIYLLPVILSTVRGFNSLQIGLVMIVIGVFQFISGPIAGQMEKRMDQRLMLAVGLSLYATGFWLFSNGTAETGFAQLFWPQMFHGMAIVILFLPITSIALGTLSLGEIQNASGLYNLMRNLGGAIGLAAINTIIGGRYDLHRERLAETITTARIPISEAVAAAGEDDREALTSLKFLLQLVEREARVMTFNDVWLVMCATIASGLLLIQFVRKVAR
ncbi:MAG: DHA2 family efflux MFS transporter permease subunit [Alphaproteobacteria bacterium]